MKYSEIITLVNGSIINATAHDADSSHAYKFLKLRKKVDSLFNEYIEKEKSLMKECGLEEGKKIEDNDRDKAKRYFEMRKELLDEEVVLDGIKTVPYDVWVELQRENRAKTVKKRVFVNGKEMERDEVVDILSGKVELLLEDIFWKAPEDEESPKDKSEASKEKSKSNSEKSRNAKQ